MVPGGTVRGKPVDQGSGLFAAPTRNQGPTGVHAKVGGGACSSAGERPLHTREVTGSIPVTPIVRLSEKRRLTSLLILLPLVRGQYVVS
jgi:hypothetical protein